jgi:dephospho-CoA kinase
MTTKTIGDHIMIALVGESGGGKSTSAKILSQLGFHLVELTSSLRAEAEALFDAPTRAEVQKHAKTMQKKEGNDVFARKAMANLDFDSKGDIVIDGLRNQEELEYISGLAAKNGRGFALVALVTPQDVRFERVLARQRQGDPVKRKKFADDDRRALGKGSTGFQQNAHLISIADHQINNSGDMGQLVEKLEAIIIQTRTA